MGLKPRFFGLELCLQFVDCFVDIGKTWLFPSDCISLFSLRHENQISEFPAHFEALCVGFFFVCLFVLLSFIFLNIFIYLFIFDRAAQRDSIYERIKSMKVLLLHLVKSKLTPLNP